MAIDVKLDTTRWEKKVKRAKATLLKGMSLDVKLAAKRGAWFMSLYTLPVSGRGNDWPMKQFHERINDDVRTAYVTKEDDGWESDAYSLIEDAYDKDKANEFWRRHKSQRVVGFDPDNPTDKKSGTSTAEVQFDKMRQIPRTIDPTQYYALRQRMGITGMSHNRKRLGFVQENRRAKFIRDRQSTAGLAKTAWYAVSRLIGGQQNYTKAKDATGQVVWPKPMRKIFNRFGGMALGEAHLAHSEKGYRFKIVSKVHYADDAIPGHLERLAERRARDSMVHIARSRLKHRNWDFR